jgi:hypothetical protein
MKKRIGKSRFFVVVGVVLSGTVTAALVVVSTAGSVRPQSASSPSSSGGDPGGQVMKLLVPSVSVLPGYRSGAIPWVKSLPGSLETPYVQKIEPFTDTQDGVLSTCQWSDAVLQAGFKWNGSVASLFTLLTSRLARQGWTAYPAQAWVPPMQQWHKTMASGSTATIRLSAPEGPGYLWQFDAQAPPIGKAIPHC